MSAGATRLATYQDLLDLPEDTHAEVLSGTIVTTPSPLPKHAKVQGALRSFIGKPYDDDDGFGGPGGWWIFPEVDVQLGPHDVVRPDLAGWRRKRLADPAETRPILIPPDWVCEVLSPSTATRDRVDKSQLYAAHGVAFYWLVDPDSRTLETFRLSDGHWTLSGTFHDGHVARIPPFEEVELHIGRLFLPKTVGA